MFDNIKKIRPYFHSLREIQDNVSLDIKLPLTWKYEDVVKPYSSIAIKVQEADRFVPTQNTLQEYENEVKIPEQEQKRPQSDAKAEKWRESNTWFGQDEEMTSLALGVHEKLVKENGMAYATTDEYYKRIDATMRKRFPENFNDEVEVETRKPSNVVAPATRSTSSKKVKLKTSQINLAKKLGLTPEQYAQELIKGGQ